MGGCEVMTDIRIEIVFDTDEQMTNFYNLKEAVACKRRELMMKVLGHSTYDPEWVVFDDALKGEYSRLKETLKMLDERAG